MRSMPQRSSQWSTTAAVAHKNADRRHLNASSYNFLLKNSTAAL